MTDLQEIRRHRLREWIDERHEGVQAKLCKLTGMTSSELSRLLKDKSFREIKARNIEKAAGMPTFWLDRADHNIIEHDFTTGKGGRDWAERTQAAMTLTSPSTSPAKRLITRLQDAERAGELSPELLNAIDAVLDLAERQDDK
ncbi:MAG: hypothetical protein FWC38_00840 [Proteobacteria bacterium]|nr:hypothetical protein [Pseudomonadota bacterium]MCL2306789.1 hypothetical protein [Pseudomonadota bacterium]